LLVNMEEEPKRMAALKAEGEEGKRYENYSALH
jgi:hypothetical protein